MWWLWWPTGSSHLHLGDLESCEWLDAPHRHHRIWGQNILLSSHVAGSYFKCTVGLLDIFLGDYKIFLLFLRATSPSWAVCWCRALSVCGQSIKKVMQRWRTWLGLSPCRGTYSCMRRPCCSASGGRRTAKVTRKLHRTASNTPSVYVCFGAFKKSVLTKLDKVWQLFCYSCYRWVQWASQRMLKETIRNLKFGAIQGMKFL